MRSQQAGPVTAPAEWFARQLDSRPGRGSGELSDGHARCLDVLASLTYPSGLYNLDTPVAVTDAVALRPDGGLSVLLHGELATFDNDRLTRLVVAAHKHRVRVAAGARPPPPAGGRPRTAARPAPDRGEWAPPLDWDDPAVAEGLIEVSCIPAGGGRMLHPGLRDFVGVATAEMGLV